MFKDEENLSFETVIGCGGNWLKMTKYIEYNSSIEFSVNDNCGNGPITIRNLNRYMNSEEIIQVV